MNVTWILVCDSAKARFFEIRESDPTWHKLDETLELAPPSSSKDVEKAHFAHALGKTLDHGMRSARFGHWVLVAPSHFVGMVKKELTPELAKHLMATIDKDLTELTAIELRERLEADVRIPVNEQDVIRVREPNKHEH